MFPLGTVLLPSLVLPLHVFEPRYRTLVQRCLDGVPEFGVVLIERGSEVGGGDVRTSVGTMARILEAASLPSGGYLLATVGVRRIRVVRWLADDPHPVAQVEDWEDRPAAGLEGDLRDVVRRLHRLLALRAELGHPAPPATVEVAEDPVLGSYQVAGLAPLGPLDRQRALECEGPAERLELLRRALDEELQVAEGLLRGGGGVG